MPIFHSDSAESIKSKLLEAHDEDFAEFVGGYIETIYFTETGDGEQPSSEAIMDADDIESAKLDCAGFIAAAGPMLTEALSREGYSLARAGGDFWYTRNGHGVGFWDRDELEAGGLGDALSVVAKAMGAVDWVDFIEPV